MKIYILLYNPPINTVRNGIQGTNIAVSTMLPCYLDSRPKLRSPRLSDPS